MKHVPVILDMSMDSAVVVCCWQGGTLGLCTLRTASVWAESPGSHGMVEILMRFKRKLCLEG